MPQFGRTNLLVCRIIPQLGRPKPNLGGRCRIWEGRSRIWEGDAEFGRANLLVSRIIPQLGRPKPNLGGRCRIWEGEPPGEPTYPAFGRPKPNLGVGDAEFGRPMPQFGRANLLVSRFIPQLGRPMPNLGRRTSWCAKLYVCNLCPKKRQCFRCLRTEAHQEVRPPKQNRSHMLIQHTHTLLRNKRNDITVRDRFSSIVFSDDDRVSGSLGNDTSVCRSGPEFSL